ncbi:MAG: acylase, partial [Gemmatimonadetes bacterium]|nr:acylase [Gemmatimonadota bacterium]
VWRDLRMKLFIDPDRMQTLYGESPAWLRELMDAWADGLNYFLFTHPEVEARVLQRFEPWMALTFSEGSIGGDMERPSLSALEEFYGSQIGAAQSASRPASRSTRSAAAADPDRRADFTPEPSGSNGFAIAPSNTTDGNALLLINPHTSFYFRAETHMVSEEGLNAYGAVTWGQFFIYQGFNETSGWMHTSTGADAIDEYAYEIVEREDGVYYFYGDEERRMEEREIRVPYRTATGMGEYVFTAYYSHEGPIVRMDGGDWVAVKLMNDPLNALTQSYTRTKARNLEEFLEIMELHTNSSNNTVFADAEGNIAYLHANFVPVRDTRFDWSRPVDGSDPATAWQGVHGVRESPIVINPPGGWIQNTNNWPYTAAGVDDPASPRQEDFPPYMDRYRENARGLHALRVLEGKTDFDLQGLIDAAYDSFLPAFADMVPALLTAYDGLAADDPIRDRLADPVELLRGWDFRFGVESVPTAVAIFWGNRLRAMLGEDPDRDPNAARLEALVEATDQLARDFGDWRTPWGEINRFQRLTGDIVQPFDDSEPSIPVGFTPSTWGSLAAYGQRTFNDTKRIYGTRGNSFVAVVEFGDSLRARAITAGGQSGDPSSPHFDDQAERYASGDLRPVYFYRSDVEAHAQRQYAPGDPQ